MTRARFVAGGGFSALAKTGGPCGGRGPWAVARGDERLAIAIAPAGFAAAAWSRFDYVRVLWCVRVDCEARTHQVFQGKSVPISF